jgi:hypothetical protein
MTAKTTVDWLRFRTQAQPMVALEAVRPLFGELGGASWALSSHARSRSRT